MTKELTPLEALERIKKWFPFKTNELEYQDICIIETALKRLEQAENCVFTSKEDVKKEHKALEIIKTGITEYRKEEKDWENKNYYEVQLLLTDEEYDLLKEVLL